MEKITPSTPARSRALKELRTIPGVGPRIAEHMWKIGIRSVADLRGADPESLYRAMERREQGLALARGIRARASAAEADPRARPGAPADAGVRAKKPAPAAVDRCALYVFRCAVYYASRKKHDPEKLLWWNWQDKPAPHAKGGKKPAKR